MGNNSLFTRWRPTSHFLAPAGWMNDPCAAMYDPMADVYHLAYQWHPYHFAWGNISWGYATSKDMITWTDHRSWKGNDALALGPTGFPNYNGLGIFSGTGQPVNLQGEQDGTIVLMYTSVKWLPTNWALPYHPHTESQSLAISADGGETFEEYDMNPVITATTNTAPMHWNLTGFRDPFLERFPQLDTLRGVSEPNWYAVFGSGIKGVGPRIPLWTAPDNDLRKWTFLGALFEPEGNSTLGPLLSTRSYGYNFEVSGFFALPDSQGNDHYYVNMGAEGGNISYAQYAHVGLWNEGTVSRRENGSVAFNPIAGGQADWGLGYALTSFNDTKNNRRVQYGWAEEDITGDDGIFSAKQQGFQGSLTLPRHLYVHEVDNIVNIDHIQEYKDGVIRQNADGTYTAQTLGMRPLPEVVEGIRQGSESCKYADKTYSSGMHVLKTSGSSHMEVDATITSATGACGILIAASPDMTEYTTITYQPTNNTILVDRSRSSLLGDHFNTATVTGYFSPYQIMTSDGNPSTEPISMQIFLDGSLLEVYVNDRFALSTRIYPSMECSNGYGVYVEDGAEATFSGVNAWEGLKNVWPERPADSSSMLVWDSPEETDDYVWWSGN